MKLSQTDLDVLKFYRDHHKSEGYPPSLATVSKHMGWKSANTAYDHADKLREAGKLVKKGSTPRAVVYVPAGVLK